MPQPLKLDRVDDRAHTRRERDVLLVWNPDDPASRGKARKLRDITEGVLHEPHADTAFRSRQGVPGWTSGCRPIAV